MDPRDFLQRLMDERGLNQNSLATATQNKTKQPQIHRFLKGAAKEPKRSTWQPVARLFGVPVEAFFDPKAADAAWAERRPGAALQRGEEPAAARPHELGAWGECRTIYALAY